MKKIFFLSIIIIGLMLFISQIYSTQEAKKPMVTFVELGSVRCIPCQKMQPVMKSLEKKYGEQLKVIFYDVWTAEGKPKGAEYKIRAIPTQVFLDQKGKEFHRHVGFYPEETIDSLLQAHGLTPIK